MVSIIICFYERIEYLRRCLDSLRLCGGGYDEILISDDGSSPQTVRELEELIAGWPVPIRHLWRPKKGFRLAETRNRGIRNARGEYLIFLDCDFLLLPDTIAVHLEASRPGRFVVGGCKYLTEDQTRAVLQNPVTEEGLRALDRDIGAEDLKASHRKFLLRTLLFRLRLLDPRKQSLGGHFSIHRKDIENVNGYDENFVGWGGEDEDLGIRLVKSGTYCRSRILDARVLHMWHPPVLEGRDWRQGPNIDYFRRPHIPFFCENGLVRKPDRRCQGLSSPVRRAPGANRRKVLDPGWGIACP
jgi:glycosyltransferase involved in cell wall biosynthesis